jgi:hypothetical protein
MHTYTHIHTPEDVASGVNLATAVKPVPLKWVSVTKKMLMMLPVDMNVDGRVEPQMRAGTAPGPVITSR